MSSEGVFEMGTYEILMRDGRPVATGLFRCFSEILATVDGLPEGVYDVFQELPRGTHGERNSEVVGEFTKHEGGQATYSPVRSCDGSSL